MAQVEPDDPKTWSIDRVVYQLCQNDSPPWTNSDAPLGYSIIPDRHKLEPILRKNHIDGDTLLTLSMKELRDDLAIPSYGQRRVMLNIIHFLADRYYAEEKVRLYLEKGLPTPDITQLRPHAFQSPTYAQSASDVRPSIEQSNAFGMHNEHPQNKIPPMTGHLRTGPTERAFSHQSFSAPFGTNHHGYAPSLPGFAPSGWHPQPLTNSNPREAARTASSRFASDLQLDVTTKQAETKDENVFDLLNAEIDRNLQSQIKSPFQKSSASTVKPVAQTIEPLATPKPKKRLAPTFVGNLESQEDHLGKAPLSLESTFFGEQGDSAKHFEMVESDEPSGLRSIVNSRLLNYYRRPPVSIKDSPLLVRKPYSRRKLADPFATQYVSVIGPGSTSAVNKSEDWPALKSPKLQHKILHHNTVLKNVAEPAVKITGDDSGGVNSEEYDGPIDYFDWLSRKYPPVPEGQETNENVLPGYGDSGDEGEFDEDTWEEIDAEREEDRQRAHVMTADQVNQAIDEALTEMKTTWQEKSFPLVQAKGFKRWMEAAKARSRQPQLRDVEAEVERARESLSKFRGAILRDTWNKPADVKFQCQSLEWSAKRILEYEYYVQVYHRDSAPEKPPKEYLRARGPRKLELQEGEESIGSDSDVNDFIADDYLETLIEAPVQEDDFSPVLPPSSPITRREIESAGKDVEGEDNCEVTEPSPAAATASDDVGMMSADDADVESDEANDIITPQNKLKRKFQKTPGSSQRRISKRITQAQDDSVMSHSSSDLDAGPRLPKTKFRNKGHSKQDAIELMSSDGPAPTPESHNTTDFEVKTPDLNPPGSPLEKTPVRLTLKLKSSIKEPPDEVDDYDSPPGLKNVVGIQNLEWDDIEDSSDHLRALCKIIYSLEYDVTAKLQKFVKSLAPQGRIRLLQEGIMSLDSDDGRISVVREDDQSSAALLTSLFLSYIFTRDLVKSNVPSRADLDTAYEEAMKGQVKFFDQTNVSLEVYLQHLAVLLGDKLEGLKMSKTPTKKRKHQTIQQTSNIADRNATEDEIQEPLPHETPHKKRKRVVAQSQETATQQKSDQQRVKEEALRQAQMEQRLAMMKADNKAQHHINFEEPLVQLHPHIAQRVKPHQLDGIRFMWREIIKDPKHQGCLLAHTMGLGKTMQVITLLVTISECIKSNNAKIQQYIPEPLRARRTLILCPPTLLENWYDELLMWTPKDALGPIRKISSSKQMPDIEAWANSYGVLLLSYDLFRSTISPPRSRTNNAYEKADIEEWLLARPTIVVADEAHKLKNAKSKLTGVAGRFKTLSRIALTGSPLNNHLEEYHTMIDWIAPNYLGTLVQFRDKYSEPITAGLYADSSAYERRTCLRKLHTLKRDIGPKIHRADISAIEKDMPSKTEFFFTITLTEDQRKAYDIYVKRVLETSDPEGKATQAKLFAWLADLLLLCNHPACFVAVCDRRKEESRTRYETDEESDVSDIEIETADPIDASSPENEVPFDIQTRRSRRDMTAMEEAAAVFDHAHMFQTLQDAAMSHRTMIIQQIVDKAAAHDDKTLIFSHSIPSLNYLERMMTSLGHEYQRIDGTTTMNKRQHATKMFNNNDSDVKVFLISTRAGGLGLNLQGANRVILFDFNWNPMWEQQAVGRAYRLGQQNPVFVYRFRAGGTFEDVINNKTVFKNQLFQRVVDKKNPERYAKKSIAEVLAPPKDVPKQDYAACLGKDDIVLDKIIGGLSEVIRNIELHETFEKEDNEQLTAEDLKVAEEDAEKEILRREDPDSYNRKMAQEAAEEAAKRRAQTSASYQQRMGLATIHGSWQSRFLAPPPFAVGHEIQRPSAPVNTPTSKLTGPYTVPAVQSVLSNTDQLVQKVVDANAQPPPAALSQLDGPADEPPNTDMVMPASDDDSKDDGTKPEPKCETQ